MGVEQDIEIRVYYAEELSGVAPATEDSAPVNVPELPELPFDIPRD